MRLQLASAFLGEPLGTRRTFFFLFFPILSKYVLHFLPSFATGQFFFAVHYRSDLKKELVYIYARGPQIVTQENLPRLANARHERQYSGCCRPQAHGAAVFLPILS